MLFVRTGTNSNEAIILIPVRSDIYRTHGEVITIFKVIIVDDEPMIITILRRAVNWRKYDCGVVGAAYDAQSGAAAVREHRPDILFTDIRMPDEDGLTMLAGLKPEFPHMQVTILTGYREFDYAKRAIDLSVTRFLLKPLEPAEIEEALEAMTCNLLERPGRQAAEAPDGAVSEGPDTNHHFLVNVAINQIRQNCTEKLTLSDVAERIHVSQWHLSKLLNHYVNKSFYDLLNEARIGKAKELLRDPRFSIGTVSEMVGFMDVSHFSHVFKKIENVTPKDFRNSLTNI